MRSLRPRRSSGWLIAALLAATPLAAQDLPRDPPSENDLALMGTIPLFWGERDGLAELLAADAQGHWARPVIERRFRLRPLDYLSAEALAGYRRLLLAQPRGLTAEENVALDAWVRGGGRVLLFVDPLMTGHSRFAIGDRRRPQDVALLSPILARWGLQLQFDEGQAEGRQIRDGVPPGVPVDLPGAFLLSGDAGECTLADAGIVAKCRLGDGFAMLVADAALFDGSGDDPAALAAIEALLNAAFGNRVPPPAQLHAPVAN